MTGPAEITIHRGRRTKNFTIVDNAIIEHRVLSVRARLALIHLLSKPDDWVLQIGDLRRSLGTTGRDLGRDTAYAVVCELVSVGYIEKEQLLGPDGRFQGVRYTVWDEPFQTKVPPVSGGAPGYHLAPAREEFWTSEPLPEFQETVEPVRENGVKLGGELPLPEIQETAGTPFPGFPDPVNQDLTKEESLPRTSSPLPFPQPNRVEDAPKVEGGFEAFWREWPEEERPKFYAAGEKHFLQLKASDRELAARLSPAYRTYCRRTSQPALMIPYLRDRKFLDLAEGPPIDPDGHFRIEPGRDEWGAWLCHYSERFGPRRVQSIEQLGFTLTPTRWPPVPTHTPHLPA